MEHLVSSSLIHRTSDLVPLLVVKLRIKARPCKGRYKMHFLLCNIFVGSKALFIKIEDTTQRKIIDAFFLIKNFFFHFKNRFCWLVADVLNLIAGTGMTVNLSFITAIPLPPKFHFVTLWLQFPNMLSSNQLFPWF